MFTRIKRTIFCFFVYTKDTIVIISSSSGILLEYNFKLKVLDCIQVYNTSFFSCLFSQEIVARHNDKKVM